MAGWPGTRLAPEPPSGPRAALVIATTSYEDPDLRQLRAPAHDAQDLAEILGDPGIGGFAVTQVIDADERQARRAIDLFLSGRGVGDAVVVYLSCHGVLDRRNRLYFAAADTIKDQLSSTGISAAWLLDQLEDCRARQQVLILDCCFSGAFAHGSKGDDDLDLERRLAAPGRGRVVLTASRAGEYSFEGHALPGTTVSGSVFTTALVEGLRTGAADSGGDGYVSVDEAYEYAYRYVQASGASQTPQRWLSGGEGAIVLARSPAGAVITPATLPEDLAASLDSRYPGVRVGAVNELGGWLASDDPARAMTAVQTLRQIAETDSPAVAAAARAYLAGPGQATDLIEPRAHSVQNDESTAGMMAEKDLERVRSNHPDAARLLADAERIAQSITDPARKTSALCEVAAAVAATDPDRAAQLLTDAQNAAESITDPQQKTLSLCEVAAAVAATDPDRAVQLLTDAQNAVESIIDLKQKLSSLMRVSNAVAAIDPDRAERIAESIKVMTYKPYALRGAAMAVAATNPDRAERIARSITDPEAKALALAGIVEAVAATNPDRAERIAMSITDPAAKARALAGVVEAVAAFDPDRAERIARSITYPEPNARALAGIVKAWAATNPDRAESIGQSITLQKYEAKALRDAAMAVVATNPDRAESIALSITLKAGRVEAISEIVPAVAATDPDRATRLLAQAEPLARSETDQFTKDSSLWKVAAAAAAIDPDRAERIAQSITDLDYKEPALRDVARVVAATDPDRAERIAQSITDPSAKVRSLLTIVSV